MMNTWILLVIAALLLVSGLLVGWSVERRRLLAFYAKPPILRWSSAWRVPEGEGVSLDAEWREMGYEPLGTLLVGATPAPGGEYAAAYRHPSLPVFGLINVRGGTAVASALTFWEGGGVLVTTAAPAGEARAAAVDHGLPRLVQWRVGGRPPALDGQHIGTVRAWALGKRCALPATREALLSYLADDFQRVRVALTERGPLSFPDYLHILIGRPRRILSF